MTTPRAHTLRGGYDTDDPRLDRLVQFDERSRSFQMRSLISETAPTHPPRSYTWRVGNWLDQGNEGACVGFSFAHELAARPMVVVGVTNETARQVYFDAQKIDPWEGGAYPGAVPQYEGTSVLSGAKVLKGLGHFDEYRWIGAGSQQVLDDLIMSVGYFGPAVLGLNWYQGMFRPDGEGFIRPTGSIAGGHAILCYSVSVRYKYFKLWNSWGADWGDNGTCKISFDDMARLLEEDGEGCVPIKRQKVA